MPAAWYRFLYRWIVRVYYRRVHVVGLEDKANQATLYVGLHRNGAVDGMVYKSIVPRAAFMISEQLVRSAFGRLFFTGIPVAREKDVEGAAASKRRSANVDSLALCVQELAAGGALFILPEGTSDLGPRHLPFKSGVAHILARAIARGIEVRVVPVGIFYQHPEAFRSDVTVVCGPDVDAGAPGAEARPRELMQRITAALEALGLNMETSDELRRVEVMASLAVEDPGQQYHQRLKALERAIMPEAIGVAWQRIESRVRRGEIGASLAVPAFSQRGALWSAVWLAVQLPFVIAGTLANLPVLLGAWAAGRRFADARNTIALWRILAGMPLLVLWVLVLVIVSMVTLSPIYLALWLLASVFGLWLYPELRDRWPRFRNSFAAPEDRGDVDAIRRWANDVA